MSQIHLRNLEMHPQVEVAGVVTERRNIAEAAMAGRQVFRSIEDVPADVDAFWIANSSERHAECIVAASQRGCWVFCEKPAAVSLEQIRLLNAIDPAKAAKVYVGYHRRLDHSHVRLRAAITENEIRPEILSITSRDPASRTRLVSSDVSRTFFDSVSHDMDTIEWLLADRLEHIFCVHASRSGGGHDPKVRDHLAVLARTTKGTLCQINLSLGSSYGYDQRIEVFGVGGMLKLVNSYDKAPTHPVTSVIRPESDGYYAERYARAYADEVMRFLDFVNGRSGSPCTLMEGIRALENANAADQSSRLGLPLTRQGDGEFIVAQ